MQMHQHMMLVMANNPTVSNLQQACGVPQYELIAQVCPDAVKIGSQDLPGLAGNNLRGLEDSCGRLSVLLLIVLIRIYHIQAP